MSPLGRVGALLPRADAALRIAQPNPRVTDARVPDARGVGDSSRSASAAQGTAAPSLAGSQGHSSPRLSMATPQAIIMQAEFLLQIASTGASSPALRQIAAAAYQMEIDARREMTQARVEGMAPARQWFA